MDQSIIEKVDPEILASVPSYIVKDVMAGLEDIRLGRTEPAEVVLAAVDAKIEAWKAKKAMMERHGENRPDSPTAD